MRLLGADVAVVARQVYHMEVTARLRERRLESDNDFEWLKVLRFYLEVRAHPLDGLMMASGRIAPLCSRSL